MYYPMFTFYGVDFPFKWKIQSFYTPEKGSQNFTLFVLSEMNYNYAIMCINFYYFISFQPLMVRFQAAYKSHLRKQQEKVNLELRELVSTVD